MKSPQKIRKLFLLDPDIVFLNHGSFGATPIPVFEEYQKWQRRLEHQPVQFLSSDVFEYLRKAREELARYINSGRDEIVMVPNVTTGVNIVARSLIFSEEDEILTTDHEYGACINLWNYVSQKTGVKVIQKSLPFPCASDEEIIESLWRGVTERTRVIFISHITSPTAQVLPVKMICEKAREAGILTIVDGAHAPGQVAVDVKTIGADFYVGNCHKWLCAPKGSGFLFTRTEAQNLIEPLVTGWGWSENPTISFGSKFLDYLQYTGTFDPSAFLSIPSAIQFQGEYHWPLVRDRCRELLTYAIESVAELTHFEPLYRLTQRKYHQMAVMRLPNIEDITAFKKMLYSGFKIEIPCFQWKNYTLIRLSIQGYNSQEDIDYLLSALRDNLPVQ
jgi:isopenicillin-N epimerase